MLRDAVGALEVLQRSIKIEVMKLTYLIIDVTSLIIPFVFSFHPRLQFYKRWKWFLPVLFGVAIFFCCWDILFTYLGVWGFNEKYITGIKIFNLPIEEVLFFICIPYACVFSFHCFDIFLKRDFFSVFAKWIAYTLALFLFAGAILSFERIYTLTTFMLLSGLLIVIAQRRFAGKFFFTYLVMLIPFFIVNGMLTGTGINDPVVWYNQDEIIGLRFFTIPVEDFFYAMLLMLLNVTGMKLFESGKYS